MIQTALSFIREHLRRFNYFFFLLFMGLYGYFGAFPTRDPLLRTRFPEIPALTSGWLGNFAGDGFEFLFLLIGFILFRGALEDDRKKGLNEIFASSGINRLKYLTGKSIGFFIYMLGGLAAGTAVIAAAQTAVGEAPLKIFVLIEHILFKSIPALIFTAGFTAFISSFNMLRTRLADIIYIISVFKYYSRFEDLLGKYNIGNIIKEYIKTHPEQVKFYFLRGNYVFWEGHSFDFSIYKYHLLLIGLGFSFLFAASYFYKFFSVKKILFSDLIKKIENIFTDFEVFLQNSFSGKTKQNIQQNEESKIELSFHKGNPLKRIFNLIQSEFKYIFYARLWYIHLSAAVLPLNKILMNDIESLSFAVLFPVFAVSGLYAREKKHNTYEILYSFTYFKTLFPLWKWISGFLLSTLPFAGPAILYLIKGEYNQIFMFLIGIAFLNSAVMFLEVVTENFRTSIILITALWFAVTVVEKLSFFNYRIFAKRFMWIDYAGILYNGKYEIVPILYGSLAVSLFVFSVIANKMKKNV